MARHRSIDIKTDALETGGAGIQRAVREQGSERQSRSFSPSDQKETARGSEDTRSTKRPPSAPAANASAAHLGSSFGAPAQSSAQKVRPKIAKKPPQEEETTRGGVYLLVGVLLFAVLGYFLLPFIGVNTPRPSLSFLSFLPFIGEEQTSDSDETPEETEEYNHLVSDVAITESLSFSNANNSELLRTLEDIREEGSEITAILFVTQETQREENETRTTRERILSAHELFQQLNFEVDAALPFTITAYTLGLLPENETFFVAEVRSQEVARGALYAWENEMVNDLSSLFGFDRTVHSSEATFRDKVIAGHDARVLTLPTKSAPEQSNEEEEDPRSARELLAYSFPREHVFVIGSSPDALRSVFDMLGAEND